MCMKTKTTTALRIANEPGASNVAVSDQVNVVNHRDKKRLLQSNNTK
jgi:hypothetical protein